MKITWQQQAMNFLGKSVKAERELSAANKQLDEANAKLKEITKSHKAHSELATQLAQDLHKRNLDYDLLKEASRGSYWAWQDDGYDRPETLSFACPVVVRPEVMERLAAAERDLRTSKGDHARQLHTLQRDLRKVIKEHARELLTMQHDLQKLIKDRQKTVDDLRGEMSHYSGAAHHLRDLVVRAAKKADSLLCTCDAETPEECEWLGIRSEMEEMLED